MGTPDFTDWPEPTPLGLFDLPPFPVGVLPEPFADFVAALANETQTPLDLAGMLVLSVLAATVAGRVVLTVRDGWTEPLSLWTVTSLGSGNRKTAVLRCVVEPLQTFERDLVKQAGPPLAVAWSEQRTLAATLARMETDIARLDAMPARDLPELHVRKLNRDEIAKEIASKKTPVLPRLLAEDATPEVLASLLNEHGGRIAVFSDEGGPFEHMAGRYSANRAPNLEVYLKGDSASSLRVDRVGRVAERIDRPTLTLGLAVQPGVLSGLAAKPGFRDRGLLARFLYALPRSTVGRRIVSPAPVPLRVAQAYSARLLSLLHGVEAVEEDPDFVPGSLRLSPNGLRVLLEFMKGLEPQLGEGAELHSIADWASKLPGKLARVAALFHVAARESIGEACRFEVGPLDVEAAVSLAPYLIEHARAAFGEMDADRAGSEAKALLRTIRTKGWEVFRKRDAHAAMRGRITLAADLDRPLALLEDIGYLRRQEQPEPGARGGRPPSPAFEVNPRVHANNAQNHRNPGSVGSVGFARGSATHSDEGGHDTH